MNRQNPKKKFCGPNREKIPLKLLRRSSRLEQKRAVLKQKKNAELFRWFLSDNNLFLPDSLDGPSVVLPLQVASPRCGAKSSDYSATKEDWLAWLNDPSILLHLLEDDSCQEDDSCPEGFFMGCNDTDDEDDSYLLSENSHLF